MQAAEKAKTQLKNGTNGNNNPSNLTRNLPTTFLNMNSKQISSQLESYKDMFSQILPKHLTPERMIQVSTTLISRNPQIASCTVPSIVGALLQVSIYGFDPAPQLGFCALIPRKVNGVQELQFELMYRGMIQLARNSDIVANVYAYPVYEKDNFLYQYGDNIRVKHVPPTGSRGSLVAAYAVVKYSNGEIDLEVMNGDEIMAIKKHSQARDSQYSPWNIKEFEPEMWRKTPLKRLLKRVPLSIEIQRQLSLDGGIIKPESFDTELKQADPMKTEFDVVEETPLPEPESKEQKSSNGNQIPFPPE